MTERERFEKAWAKRPWIMEDESDKDRAWCWWQAALATEPVEYCMPGRAETMAVLDSLTVRRAPMTYVYWLIEHPDNGKRSPHYFGWEEGERGWTSDLSAAFKFETQGIAEQFANEIGIQDWRVIDHQFLDHKPTSNLDVA